jgi:enoyl-CoA hydratase/carnithine racemase
MAVSFSAQDGIGFITLEKPPANSYDLSVMQEFSAAVDAAVAGGVRVVVVRSAVPRFFSAGADVRKFLDGDVDSNMEMIRVSQAAFARMAAAPEVFIAWVGGHALGGGLEIALACDVASVFDASSAGEDVQAYAARLAAGPALALAAIKRCVHEGGGASMSEGLALEASLVETLFRSRDAAEGLHAFVEKRAPEFVGA